MKKALAVSIIVPSYNESENLRACLDAIAAQDVRPKEVIVVDNNSTDDTADIAHSYRFVRVVHEKEQGIVHARNAGFNAAAGDIIGRIDADSLLPPTWVAAIIDFYKNPKHRRTAFSGGSYFYNIRWPRLTGWLQSFVVFPFNWLPLRHHITYGSNMAITQEMWQRVKKKVCARADIHEDTDLAIHLHECGYKIAFRDNDRVRVGAKIRRWHGDRPALWANLMLWPDTLRTHHKLGWVIGWLGAAFLYIVVPWIPAGSDSQETQRK